MKKGQKQALAVGAGVAALAAAATGAYFLTGKRGAKNRKKISQWTDKAKKDVVAELKKVKTVSKGAYESAVDTVAKRYKDIKNVDAGELAMVVSELKGHWDNISKGITGANKTVKKAAKKTAPKKAAKKSAKKPAKKAR